MTAERRTYNKGSSDGFGQGFLGCIIRLFKEKSHFFKDERFRGVVLALLYNPEDKLLRGVFEQMRQEKEIEDALHPDRKFQPAKEDLDYAEDVIELFPAEHTNCLIPFPVSRIPNHIAIAGPSGSGKTICCKNLIVKEAGKVTILAFDGAKEQLRNLANAEGLENKGIVRVWKWFEFKIAALQPEWKTRLAGHVNTLMRNIEYSYGLAASARFGKDNLKKLYERYGIVEGKKEQPYPTLRQWLDFMISVKPRDEAERRYRATFSKALSDLIDSTAEVFDVSYSEYLDELFRQGTINVIEVHGLPFEALSFFITFITDWLFARRLRDEESV